MAQSRIADATPSERMPLLTADTRLPVRLRQRRMNTLHSATAAESRARQMELDASVDLAVDPRLKLAPGQEASLSVYYHQFTEHVASIAKMHWAAKGLIWVGLAEVVASYAILAIAANNVLFEGVSSSAMPALGFIGAVVLANSVGLNTYINRMTFNKRMSQIITNVSAWRHGEASLFSNPGRFKFDLARMSVGLLLSLVYSFPFWKAVSDDSPHANTSNPHVNQLSDVFFAVVSYLAIPTRTLLVFNSVVAITNKLPVNGHQGFVHRVQAEIITRLDTFNEWVAKELKKDKEKRNNRELWSALNNLQKQINVIHKLSQDIAQAEAAARRSQRRNGYGTVAENVNSLYEQLEMAWQRLGAIIAWYPVPIKPVAPAQGPAPIASYVAERSEVPRSTAITEQLQASSQKLKAWINENKGLALYRVSTYLVSITIAAGYVYSQKAKTEEGTSEVFHTKQGDPVQETLVWGALIAAGLFSAHWTYMAFDKMSELWQTGRKAQIFWTALAVACTAAPAVAIASNNQVSTLLIIASAIAGGLMNYVGQRGVLDLLSRDNKLTVLQTSEAVQRAHGTAAKALGELLTETINSIKEQVAGDYSVSAKGIIAIGSAWNIHVAGMTTEQALAAVSSSCCGCGSMKCSCKRRNIAPVANAQPTADVAAYGLEDPYRPTGSAKMPLLAALDDEKAPETILADSKAVSSDAAVVPAHVAVAMPAVTRGHTWTRHLPRMSRKAEGFAKIVEGMCGRPQMRSPYIASMTPPTTAVSNAVVPTMPPLPPAANVSSDPPRRNSYDGSSPSRLNGSTAVNSGPALMGRTASMRQGGLGLTIFPPPPTPSALLGTPTTRVQQAILAISHAPEPDLASLQAAIAQRREALAVLQSTHGAANASLVGGGVPVPRRRPSPSTLTTIPEVGSGVMPDRGVLRATSSADSDVGTGTANATLVAPDMTVARHSPPRAGDSAPAPGNSST